ncbi:MAG: fibronectin type III domain-containing protein [Sphingobacteriales bacterium]|nr:MAG: fibronectin type III domain-containing protein [Sphingobacteriales bacterium]
MSKAVLYLYDKKPAELLVFARNIHFSMTDQAAVFTLPPVAMADLLVDINALSKAIEDALGGGKKYISLRNSAVRKVREDLMDLAAYVQIVSKGDKDIILSAGMEVAKVGPRRYEDVGVPVDVRSKAVGSNIIVVSFRKVRNARNYQIEMCEGQLTADGWKQVQINSTTSAYIPNLITGKVYYFRVRSLGTETMKSNWSDITHIMAL